jgi:predicted oxidoreductase
MVQKVFRIVSNSDSLLNAETVALALLRQVTLSSSEKVAVFGVQELKETQVNKIRVKETKQEDRDKINWN